MTNIFPNDELSYVSVPEGLSCYVTDKDSFGGGGAGVSEHVGPVAEIVVPDGKVSSIAVWPTAFYKGHADYLKKNA